MECPNCGKEIDDDVEYCPNCGEKFVLIEEKGLIDKLENLDLGKILFLLIGITISVFVLIFLIGTVFKNPIVGLCLVGIVVIAATIWLSKHIKDIVVAVGRKVLDIGTSLNVILSVVIIIIGFFQCKDDYGISEFIWFYIIGAIIYFLITLLADYTLYVLIDIRDSLKKLADKSDKQ